jgi:hypothetical protein
MLEAAEEFAAKDRRGMKIAVNMRLFDKIEKVEEPPR